MNSNDIRRIEVTRIYDSLNELGYCNLPLDHYTDDEIWRISDQYLFDSFQKHPLITGIMVSLGRLAGKVYRMFKG